MHTPLDYCATANNSSPIAVAEYSTKLIDKKLLESKLIEFKDLLANQQKEKHAKNILEKSIFISSLL